jgi:hypothetical protein
MVNIQSIARTSRFALLRAHLGPTASRAFTRQLPVAGARRAVDLALRHTEGVRHALVRQIAGLRRVRVAVSALNASDDSRKVAHPLGEVELADLGAFAIHPDDLPIGLAPERHIWIRHAFASVRSIPVCAHLGHVRRPSHANDGDAVMWGEARSYRRLGQEILAFLHVSSGTPGRIRTCDHRIRRWS